MNAIDRGQSAVLDYLDALLQPGPPASAAEVPEAAIPEWWSCTLGRLQLLLPGNALGPPLEAASLSALPDSWHLAQIDIANQSRRILEVSRCIAPALAAPPVTTLIPVRDRDVLLALPGKPEPIELAADAIQWRATRSSRPWLAGMSRDAQHVALDVLALIECATTTSTTQEPTA